MDPSKPYLMTTFVTHFDQTYKVEEAVIELYDPVNGTSSHLHFSLSTFFKPGVDKVSAQNKFHTIKAAYFRISGRCLASGSPYG